MNLASSLIILATNCCLTIIPTDDDPSFSLPKPHSDEKLERIAMNRTELRRSPRLRSRSKLHGDETSSSGIEEESMAQNAMLLPIVHEPKEVPK